MISSKFEYRKPTTVDEAVELYGEFEGGAVYLSGGTDLVPRMKLGLEKPVAVIDLKGIEALNRIEDQGKWIRIGSLVSLFDLRQDKRVCELFPALRCSLEATSCETLQLRGTIGGNLLQDCRCLFYNQSEFWRKSKGFCLKMGGEKCNAVPGAKTCFANYCSDNATSLLALSAELELSGPNGSRRITMDELYTGKSDRPFSLQPGEILTSIFVANKKTLGGYEKLRVRGAIDYPLLGVAFSFADGSGSLAVGGIGARPVVAQLDKPSKETLQKAIEVVSKQINPVNNTILDRDYRKRMVPTLAERLVNKVMEGAK